ncbi:MAG: ArsR/SmtB family transcription factor [Omnitrophica WOR_2 bacterium]
MDKLNLPQELIDFAKSLASESRFSILLLFMDKPELTVNQIAEAVHLGQPTTSEHLAVLKRSGVLVSHKRGKEVFYSPNRVQIRHNLKTLTDIMTKCCED